MTTPHITPYQLRLRLSTWAREHSPTSSAEDAEIRAQFVQKFPLDSLKNLTLDQYVIGRGDQDNYCYWLERRTNGLGSMAGGAAKKFGVYWSTSKQTYVFNRMFKDAEDAKARILSAIRAGSEKVAAEEYAAADEVTSQMGESRFTMRLKPQTLYFPDRLLPINNPNHLQHFLRLFGQEPSGGPISLNRQLLEFLQALPDAHAYDTLGLMRFLYHVYPPSRSEVGGNSAVEVHNADVQAVLDVAEHSRNIILYGPPGTGKTHAARAFSQIWLAPEPAVPVNDQGTVASTWWQAVALALHELGTATAEQIQTHPVMQRFAQQRQNTRVSNTVWAELLIHTHPSDPSSNTARRAKPYLFTRASPAPGGAASQKSNTAWTLSDEGREYISQLTAGLQPTPEPPQALYFVTFHPAFTYEEFIQGLRPTATGGFEIRDGVFKRLCDAAHQNPDQDFVLIIDEINRADTAKTFGELITLIEDGKRAKAGERGQYEVTLPYAPQDAEPFSVPDNVYVIGTMNTADRSITLMDVALRRRFTFIAVPPRPELLSGVVQGTALSPMKLLTVLNQHLTRTLDADHQIGHAYLMAETLTPSGLSFRWRHKIVPLLQEYFYARDDELRTVLGETLYLNATGQQALSDQELVQALLEFTR